MNFARHQAWIALGALWLLLVGTTLGIAPLTPREGLLMEESSKGQGLPLFQLVLWSIEKLGPPAETLFRFLGLGACVLGSIAAHHICRTFGTTHSKRHSTAWIAALGLGCHGTLILSLTDLSPFALLWGSSAALALLVLEITRVPIKTTTGTATRPGLLIALSIMSLACVGTEPISLISLLIISVWLSWKMRHTSAAIALLAPGVGVVILLSTIGSLHVPTMYALDRHHLHQLASAITGINQLGPIASVGALLITGLAIWGLARAPRDLALLCLAGLATAVGVFVTRSSELWGNSAALFLPPLLILCVQAVASIEAGPTSKVWALFIVGLCSLTGLSAVISGSDRLPTRSIADALEPEVSLVASREGVAEAVAFYRPIDESDPQGATRLWIAGDNEPRMVAVQAFGDQIGPSWLVSSAEPLYDLGANLQDAEVTYRERGLATECYWQDAEPRFFCGGPHYQRVMWSYSEFAGVEADAVLVHPLDDGEIEISWVDIPLGHKLFGIAGLDDRSVDFSSAPVHVEISVTGQPPLRFSRGMQRGLLPFEIDTSNGPERGSVSIHVTTPDDRGRHLFIDGLILN